MMHQPAVLKRKRTLTNDEDLENNPPIVVEGVDDDNLNWANGLLSPESEPYSSNEQCIDERSFSSDGYNPHLLKYSQSENKSWSKFRAESNYDPLTPPASEHPSPLPALPWADPQEVWVLMCCKNKDSLMRRSLEMFDNNKQITPRMRAILLDWLIEVCEVYKLHRETYHISVDMIDRYLLEGRNIPKGQLQLIGITCLFISAKVEEIYPPKICEFAYVTDGACSEKEILEKEIIILKDLKWNLSPVTAIGWLTMYMQLCCDARRRADAAPVSDTFVYPQYSGLAFVQTVQLVDLCTLDEGSLNFSYSVLAAAALCHMGSRELALTVSGLRWEDMSKCVEWALPFALTVQEESAHHVTSAVRQGSAAAVENATGSGLLKAVPHIVMDNSHNIQTHTVDLQMLDKAKERSPKSPAICSAVPCPNPPLTPPSSHKKPSDGYMALTGTFT